MAETNSKEIRENLGSHGRKYTRHGLAYWVSHAGRRNSLHKDWHKII